MSDIMKKIEVLGSMCLVEEIKYDAETASGIIIPGKDKEHTSRGIVLKTGEGSILENGNKVPVSVKPGDHVLYTSFSGYPVKVKDTDEDKYLIINERDIICKYFPDE